jgi:hypothetical protein
MVVSHHQNVGQNQNLLFANKSSENVVKFKCLETTVRNQKEEIRSRLNSVKACYHCSESVFPSPL